MHKSNLPGLSPVWLISLAMVLGTVIVVLIPAAISGGDAIKASDWIGFAGNIVAGVMTLIAAATAWIAVQRTITAQSEIARSQAKIAADQAEIARVQTEVQRISLLHEHIAIAEADVQAIHRIMQLTETVAAIPGIAFKNPIVAQMECEGAEKFLKEYGDELEAAIREFELIGTKRRGVLGDMAARMKIGIAVAGFRRQIVDLRREVLQLRARIANSPAPVANPNFTLTSADTLQAGEASVSELKAKIFALEKKLKQSADSIGV